jgi:hypothetical protein
VFKKRLRRENRRSFFWGGEQKMTRKKKIIIFSSIISLLAGVILIFYLTPEKSKEPKGVAITFYRATWVEGNQEKAQKLLADPDHPQLKKELAEYQNPKVLIVENPQQPQTDEYRSYFIHRPTDEHGFKVSLEKIKGSWKVVKFEHQETNGYITANYYWPGLKDQWEEVQP